MSSTPSLKYSKRIAAIGAASAAVLSLGTASAAVTTINANVLIGGGGAGEFNFVPNGSSYASNSYGPAYLGNVIQCSLWLLGRTTELQWTEALLTEGAVVDATGTYGQSRFFTIPAEGVTVHGGYRYSDTENGRDYYGYVTITGNGSDSFTVDSYTYESTPNTGISIGAVPEASSALLAFAGAGLLFRRRRVS